MKKYSISPHDSLYRCNEKCSALDDLLSKLCVLNKTEYVNLNVFNIIKRTIESKIITKHNPCNCKCKFHGRKCNSNQKWKYWYGCKNPIKHHACEKNYSTCACEIENIQKV